MKALTVYKASAGSGKTFTLATEYIRLLVENPNSYRNILAVTFTNKATEEMKQRILSQLYGISKQLHDSRQYLQRIVSMTGYDEQTVSRRAGEALHLLLHNYSYFRVETIDSFFQSVLRNLARELDLAANLHIGLNDKQVEEKAVDQLIDSLTRQDAMLQWLLSYIMECISEDRSWNIISQVKKFGLTIFRDYYKEHSQQLTECLTKQGFFEGYTSQLRQMRKQAQESMQQYASEFFDTLEAEGLTIADLAYGKSGVASFFLKLQNGQMDEGIIGQRVCDCREDAAKWYTKKHQRAQFIHDLADSQLIPLLAKAIDDRPRKYRIYQSADLTLRHLSQLRLLGSIEQKVHELNNESNRFLLSDTQHLLHTMISNSDSPFIFEKIGTQLEHIMIDEFQDTSTVQWQNFKVLLEECMSHKGSSNLIVGDVKQSIYRWRSGDWRLLNAIDSQFPHAADMIDIQPLATNYRSERNIVTFNNAFFTEAARLEYQHIAEDDPQGAEQLKNAYADVKQEVPDSRGKTGLVSIQLLPVSDYEDTTLKTLADTVRHLHDEGAAYSEMAILVRVNRIIPLIASYFAANMPEVHIVSDEAFRLDASTSVCLLVQSLHVLTHPDDLLAKAAVAKLYQRTVLGNEAPESELIVRDRPLDTLLPEAFTQHTTELLQLPLYELVERLYDIFQLQRIGEQSAYLCAFYDQLAKFTQDNTVDIDAFIREWDESLSSKTIQSDISDGIRILSIHKSKGLEFEHVLIPFCDWRLEMPDTLWCEPNESPYNALPIVPVEYRANQLRGTVYEDDYQLEHLQNCVDNLNLLYVAFTRASRNLFVIGKRGNSLSRSALIEEVLPAITLEGSTLEGDGDQQQPMTFTYGTLAVGNQQDDRQPSENVFLQPVKPEPVTIESFDMKTEFRQSNKSREFVEGEDETKELSYIKMGSILHEVFSTIRTTADIEPALQQMQQDGIIYDDDVTREKLLAMLHKRLESNTVKDWFSERWQLFNECSILNTDREGNVTVRRPDRVMTDGSETHVVDFKFGSPRDEYHEQVREYMQLLSQMGMPDVKGWLWYVYSNRIEEVR